MQQVKEFRRDDDTENPRFILYRHGYEDVFTPSTRSQEIFYVFSQAATNCVDYCSRVAIYCSPDGFYALFLHLLSINGP